MCTVQDTIYVFANRRIRDLSYVNVGTLFYKAYNLGYSSENVYLRAAFTNWFKTNQKQPMEDILT